MEEEGHLYRHGFKKGYEANDETRRQVQDVNESESEYVRGYVHGIKKRNSDELNNALNALYMENKKDEDYLQEGFNIGYEYVKTQEGRKKATELVNQMGGEKNYVAKGIGEGVKNVWPMT